MSNLEPYRNIEGPKFSPGISPVYVFIGFAFVVAILGGSIWLVSPLLDQAVSRVTNSTSLSKTELADAISSISAKASLDTNQNNLETEAPAKGVDFGPFSIESLSDGLVVHRKYQDSIKIPNNSTKGHKFWLGILKNPFLPLSTVGGDPFFDPKKYNIESSGSVIQFTKNIDNSIQISDSTFPVFSFFSDSPTTIGIVKGEYSKDLKVQLITLYLFDTETPKSAVINSSSMSFPGWIKQEDSPPSFYTTRYATLTPVFNALGDGVIQTVQSYRDAEYQYDKELESKLFSTEFNNAMLTRAELQILETTNIDKLDSLKQENWSAVRKLVRLLYYAPSVNKTGPVRALLEKVHPSIKKAALSRTKNDFPAL